MIERKRRIKAGALNMDSSNARPSINVVSKNWANAGFFDATLSLESIRHTANSKLTNISQEGQYAGVNKSYPKLQRKLTRKRSSMGDYTVFDVLVGDVFEQVRVQTGPLLLFKVVEVFPQSMSALVQSDVGREKKTWRELCDRNLFRLLVTEGKMETEKRQYVPQRSIRDPLLQEKAKYSGTDARNGLFSLFRLAPDESSALSPIKTRTAMSKLPVKSSGVHSTASHVAGSRPKSPPSPVLTPRIAYIRACRKDKLPPIPLLAKCYDDAYPVLDLTDQSIGERFCSALAESIPSMWFLKEVNLTGNRLDQKGARTIIRGIARSNVESIVLDNNRIGKQGMLALIAGIKGSDDSSSATTTAVTSQTVTTLSSSRLPPLHCLSGGSDSNITTAAPTERSYLRLVKVSLNDNGVGDNLTSRLLRAIISHSQCIRHLSLRGNNCGMFTARAAAELLGDEYIHLEFLDLSWNSLKTDDAGYILTALPNHSHMTTIHLDWNGIGIEVLELLRDIAISNTILQAVTIQQNHIPDKVLLQLESLSDRPLKFRN